MNIFISTIRTAIRLYPNIEPLLKDKARWIIATSEPYKTYDFFLSTLQRMVTNVYENRLGGDFIDIMASLIYGQLDQAYHQAWTDEGDGTDYPQYLADSFEEMYLGQYDFVDQFYRDIVDARIDQAPIEPLLQRITLWVNRWNEAYNEALRLIAADNGDNMIWQLGETEEHCPECNALNGIVARASDWESLNVHPQGAPNDKISCGGWQCGCSLTPTDKRRSPKAYDSILNIVGGQKGF